MTRSVKVSLCCTAEKLPPWLKRNPETQTRSMRRNILYFLQLWLATPVWANEKKIKEIYKTAQDIRRNGEPVAVDHIVPVNNPFVCGLHCEHNLQIIHEKENGHKSNNHWPDMPGEQLTFDV
jgi:hypothetical protein